MSASDDETYTIPLKDQRYFGAGLKRKRVQFVPASDPATLQPSGPSNGASASDLYLSIVGSKKPAHDMEKAGSTPEEAAASVPEMTCDVCKLPLAPEKSAVPHEASLAHQVCLQHSHPPSAIERNRKGLSFMQAYGWDVDGRKGLGKDGDGMLYPIKLKEKRDTVGLGVQLPKSGRAAKAKVEKLNAKQVRQQEEEGKKRRSRLQTMFYSNDDVLRHLGEG